MLLAVTGLLIGLVRTNFFRGTENENLPIRNIVVPVVDGSHLAENVIIGEMETYSRVLLSTFYFFGIPKQYIVIIRPFAVSGDCGAVGIRLEQRLFVRGTFLWRVPFTAETAVPKEELQSRCLTDILGVDCASHIQVPLVFINFMLIKLKNDVSSLDIFEIR